MDFNQAYRAFVLAVAGNPAVRSMVLTRGRAFSRRFIAGDTLEEALQVVDALERSGIHAILDLLGEEVTSKEMARGFKDGILGLIRAFGGRSCPRYVSLKPTQVGLSMNPDLTVDLLKEILEEARKSGCFVRLDMEDSSKVDATLRVYRRLREAGFENTGVVLQSYLRRTGKDLEDLLPLKPAVRLVKGAYKEPPEAAFQDRRTIDAQYVRLTKRSLEAGLPTAIATHDPRIIGEMKRWVAEKGIGRDRFEFQMLYGIRRDEQKDLSAGGYVVRAYVPYGTEWYPYFSRRIAERPENLVFVARSLVQG
jgi:proline dehydrogenase